MTELGGACDPVVRAPQLSAPFVSSPAALLQALLQPARHVHAEALALQGAAGGAAAQGATGRHQGRGTVTHSPAAAGYVKMLAAGAVFRPFFRDQAQACISQAQPSAPGETNRGCVQVQYKSSVLISIPQNPNTMVAIVYYMVCILHAAA